MKKTKKKTSAKTASAIIAAVKREMQKPRLTESVRKDGLKRPPAEMPM